MTTRTPSPGAHLDSLPVGSYVRASDLPGSGAAARAALSRAARRGELVNAARGLYFKGPKTRYGMARPKTIDIAVHILGEKGTGPTGYTAARCFGLTTQVPAKVEIATVRPSREGIQGVKIHTRNNPKRGELWFYDIALLEVLRQPEVVDNGWTALVDAIRKSVKARDVHPKLIAEAVAQESPTVRSRWAQLVLALNS